MHICANCFICFSALFRYATPFVLPHSSSCHIVKIVYQSRVKKHCSSIYFFKLHQIQIYFQIYLIYLWIVDSFFYHPPIFYSSRRFVMEAHQELNPSGKGEREKGEHIIILAEGEIIIRLSGLIQASSTFSIILV